MSGGKSNVVSGALWLAATKATGQAITWIITITVMRLLSPADYGLMGMATLIMGFLFLFNELGLGAAIVQRQDLTDTQLSSLASAIFLMNAGLAAALFLSAPLVASYFREPALANIVRLLSTTFLICGIGTPSVHTLTRRMEFKKTSRAEFAGNVTGALVTLVLALTGFGVWSLIIGYMTQGLVINGVYLYYCRVKIARTFSFSSIRSFVNFGFQVASSRILWYISSNADFMVVGRVLGTVQLGYYNLAFQLASLPIDRGVSVITQVAFPFFSSRQADNAALRRDFLRLTGLVALVSCPIFFGLFAVAEVAVSTLLTAKWLPVIVPLQLLCLVSWFRGIVSLNSPLVIAKGRPRIVIHNFLLQAIVMPACFFIGSKWGLLGVSLAWVLAWPFLAFLITWQTLQLIELRVQDYARALVQPLLGSAAMVVVVMFMRWNVVTGAPNIVRLVALCVTGGAVYAGYMMLFNKGAITDAIEILKSARSTRDAGRVAATSVPAAAGATTSGGAA